MKNSKLRRALLLVACAVMLVSLSVGATLAYLTSTDTVVNTFAVGSVNITLDEADVHEVGEPGTSEQNQGTKKTPEVRVKTNNYKVYPDGEYDKDPTVHITAGSEKCYVGVVVKLSATNWAALMSKDVLGYDEDDDTYLGFGEIISGGIFNDATLAYAGDGVWNGNGIKLIQDNVNGVFYIVYTEEKDASANQVDLVLFDKVSIPEDWGNTELAAMGGLNMDIKAYAVQKDGFNDAETALLAGFPTEFAILNQK